jgi:hypothetical protein
MPLLLFCFGCGDDDDPVKSTAPGSITVTGKIEGWTGGETKTLYASDQNFNWEYFDLNHTVGSCKIAADGSFNLTLAEPHKLMMDSLVNRFPKSAFNSGVHLYSPNAKYVELNLYVGERDSIIGKLYMYGKTPAYTSPYNGDFYPDYIYVDTAAVINGTFTYDFLGSSHSIYFDINFKQGWNKYTHYYQSNYVEKYMTDDMGDAKLIYNKWPNRFIIVD